MKRSKGLDAPIQSLAPWAGAKRFFATEVVELLGEHSAYFEPFCGSMAVLFGKPACRHEVVNDLNRDLVNVAVVLQSRYLARQLLERLHFTLAAEELFRESRALVLEPLAGPLGNVDRAYHAMVTWWLGRNGIAGTKKSRTNFSARFTPNGGSGGVRFRNMVESVTAFIDRLERVDVLNRDGFEVIEKIEDLFGTAIYIDPPYIVKSFEYEHDFLAKDHPRLAAAVSRFERARVVISYYDHPDLLTLYPPERWTVRKFAVTKAISNTSDRSTGSTKATEVLITNTPSLSA